MCSTWGIVSVPAGSRGWGSEPGCRSPAQLAATGWLGADVRQAAAGATAAAHSGARAQLGTWEEAAAWLRASELLAAEAGLSNSEYAALLRLRESIRDVLAAHTGGPEDGDAAARLTKALADGRLVLTVDAASAVHL